MTFLNESNGDRAVRMLAGLLLASVGWSLTSGVIAAALMVVGTVSLGTGILGWCPAYALFGISTRRADTAR